MTSYTDEQRREYWAQQMDAAYDFMMRALEWPVAECGESVTSLLEASRQSGVKVLFSQSEIVPGVNRLFYLRQSLIAPLLAAAQEFNKRGWILVVEDGFRTTEMQRRLSLLPKVFDAVLNRCIWEYGGMPPVDLVRRRLAALTAAYPQNGTHMSATALDISVQNANDGMEVNRGKPYLEMSEFTPMKSPFVDKNALNNRLAIRTIMEKHGFMAYPYEFWHYNQGDVYDEILHNSNQPARFGAVHCNIETGEVIPVENPQDALNSNAQIEREMNAAMARASKVL